MSEIEYNFTTGEERAKPYNRAPRNPAEMSGATDYYAPTERPISRPKRHFFRNVGRSLSKPLSYLGQKKIDWIGWFFFLLALAALVWGIVLGLRYGFFRAKVPVLLGRRGYLDMGGFSPAPFLWAIALNFLALGIWWRSLRAGSRDS